MSSQNLLIVDDEQNVINSLRRELRGEHYTIYSANSGQAGLELVKEQRIDVVLSDQMMPGMDGISFLERVRQYDPDVTRILLTGHGSLKSAMSAVNNCQIYSYLTKPWSTDNLKDTIARAFLDRSLAVKRRRIEAAVKKRNRELKRLNDDLVDLVQARTGELDEAIREGVVMLAVAAEAKDDDSGQHVHRIQELSLAICIALGIPLGESQQISFFSMMHDIGKIHIPDSILRKRGPLTSRERQIMQTHCVAGETILSNKRFYKAARQIARSHHERWDGNGYPDGLKGEAIPLPARIVAVANIFDSLTHEHPYDRPVRTVAEALAEMEAQSGKAFDPEVLSAFVSIQTSGPRQSRDVETQDAAEV